MRLATPGNSNSAPEVTHIAAHGVWLLNHGKELFMPYEHFPWFRGQPVRVTSNVQEPLPGHFHWPDIDVDLTEEIIEHPERFPNVADSPWSG